MAKAKRKYRVVGSQPVEVAGHHHPGEEFDASIDKTHEEFLLGIGALEVVKDSKDK